MVKMIVAGIIFLILLAVAFGIKINADGRAPAPVYEQCEYSTRTTNTADNCDNTDPCDPAAVKGGSGDCE